MTSGPATLITPSEQTLTIDEHSGNTANAESWSDSVTFRVGTQNDAGGEDDTVELTLTPAAPFATAPIPIMVKLKDLDAQSFTLDRPTADRSKAIKAGDSVTLELKSTLPVETSTIYSVTTSDPTVATVTPLATPATDTGNLVDQDLTVVVSANASNGDTAQIVVTAPGVGTGAAAVIVADYLVRVGSATTTTPTLTFTPASVSPISVVAGTAMTAVTLPEAMGGTMPYTYTVTPALPMGLMFDSATRMLSGTPMTAAPMASFTYTAMDSATTAATGELMFDITVTAGPSPPPVGTGRATFTSAVVKGGGGANSRTVVVAVSGQGIRLTAPGTLETIESAFRLSTRNAVDSVSGLSPSSTTLAREFEITFTTFLNGTETLYYTPPPSGRLADGSGDIREQRVAVDPVTPRFRGSPYVAPVERGMSVMEVLPEVQYGGKQPITYELRNALANGNEGTVVTSSTVSINRPGTAAGPITSNSGLYFDARTRTITGRAMDVGTYPLIYTATAAMNNGEMTEHQVHFNLQVVGELTTPASTDGRITMITVGDADGDKQPTETIGRDKRIHLTEGGLSEVFVTVQWSHEQITALRRGGATPDDAEVGVMVVAFEDDAAWLSPAETSERPGTAQLGGYDAVLATNRITVKVPAAPRTNPNSMAHFKTATGKTTLSLPHDVDAEEEAFVIQVVPAYTVGVMTGANQGAHQSGIVVIEDDETQGIMLSRDPASTAPVLEGGNDVTFKSVAKPPREDLPLQVRYDVTDSKGVSVSSQLYTLTGASGTILGGDDAKDNVTFTTPANDGDRADIDLQVHAEVVSFSLSSGAFDDVQSDTVDITVLDVHKLPMLRRDTVKPMTADVDEDGEVELMMQIDRNPANTIRRSSEGQEYTSEPVTVMFSMGAGSTVNGADYEIMGNPVKVDKHNGRAPWTQDVKVTIKARADQALDDMEMLVLDVVIDGTENTKYGSNTDDDTYRGVATLTIKEGTARLVWAKTAAEVEAAIYDAKTAGMGADDMLTAGEMIKVKGNDLFGSGEGVTLSFSAETSDATVASYMVSGDEVTVTAEGKGDAMITITAHASMPSGVTINEQTDTREASITFPVSVALEPLTIDLEGPDAGMHLVEGMEYTLTAKANRAVEMATTVELLQTDGTASPADYEVASITINSGESMGTAKLMVKEDDMDEHGGGMEESLTLGGRVGTMKTNALTFYLWDKAVPALPVIAQLLLAAFLAVGGYRRYRRR